MAGWPLVANDAELKGFRVDLGSSLEGLLGQKAKIDCKFRSWFYNFLKTFLKEICGLDSGHWPFPPMLGNGQYVDLLKLFLVVRENGGYHTVTENGLWNLVAKQSGLNLKSVPLVKLVYIKYLDALERWLARLVDDKESEPKLSDCELNVGGASMELKAEFKGFLSEMEDSKCSGLKPDLNVDGVEADDESMLMESSKNIVDFIDVEKSGDDLGKSGVMDGDSSDGEEKCKILKKNRLVDFMNSEKLSIEDELKSIVMEIDGGKECDGNDGEDDALELDSAAVEELITSRKRKRESIGRMLNWITGIARNPCDTVVVPLPEMSKWKSYGNDEMWKQILFVREALFLKRGANSKADHSLWQTNQKMHPCMYADHVGSSYNLRERLKSGKKLVSGKLLSQMQACSQSSSAATQNDFDSCTEGSCDGDSSTERCVVDLPTNKRIPLGPDFQADVPEWTDAISESDSKWVGTRVWPLENVNQKLIIEREPIGKGRQDSCGCQQPKSIECVRFHCSERKLRVMRELGVAFHQWRFDKIGEEVKLSWTAAEEKKFKSIVRSNPPSLDKCFWDEIVKFFHYKRREDLVSYYYNVFLLQRRAHQNRFTPSKVDSDDDESELGLVTQGTGNDVSKSPGLLLYSAKKLCKNDK